MNLCMDEMMGRDAGIDDKYLGVAGYVKRPEAGLSSRKEPEVSASETELSKVIEFAFCLFGLYWD